MVIFEKLDSLLGIPHFIDIESIVLLDLFLQTLKLEEDLFDHADFVLDLKLSLLHLHHHLLLQSRAGDLDLLIKTILSELELRPKQLLLDKVHPHLLHF